MGAFAVAWLDYSGASCTLVVWPGRGGAAPTDDQILEHYGELEAAAEAGPYQPYRAVLAAVVDGLGARLGFAPSPEERASLAASVGDWPPFPDTVAALRSLARRYRLVV